MYKPMVAGVMVVFLSANAFADGKWDGVSVGLTLGSASSKSSVSSTPSDGSYFQPTSPGAIGAASAGNANTQDAFAGLNIGYNQQVGNVVYGGIVDYTSLNIDNERTGRGIYPCCSPFGFSNKITVSSDWLATVRGRVGYAYNNSAVYVTGGVAATKVNIKNQWVDDFAAAADSSGSKAKFGWVAGLGYEYALDNNWRVKGEYLYAKFDGVTSNPGNLRLGGSTFTDQFTASGNLTIQLFQVGVNRTW